MRRALIAGAALGLVAGLLFVHHDVLRLSVAWPIVLGFALWETVGKQGSRGLVAALAGLTGVAIGYVSVGAIAEFMPVTDLSFGLVVGIAIGVMVLGGVLAGDRFPLGAMLIGFGTFMALMEPLWAESPANFRTHGIETFTIAALGLLVGILSAAVVRAAVDVVRERSALRHPDSAMAAAPAEPDAHFPEITAQEGGAS